MHASSRIHFSENVQRQGVDAPELLDVAIPVMAVERGFLSAGEIPDGGTESGLAAIVQFLVVIEVDCPREKLPRLRIIAAIRFKISRAPECEVLGMTEPYHYGEQPFGSGGIASEPRGQQVVPGKLPKQRQSCCEQERPSGKGGHTPECADHAKTRPCGIQAGKISSRLIIAAATSEQKIS